MVLIASPTIAVTVLLLNVATFGVSDAGEGMSGGGMRSGRSTWNVVPLLRAAGVSRPVTRSRFFVAQSVSEVETGRLTSPARRDGVAEKDNDEIGEEEREARRRTVAVMIWVAVGVTVAGVALLLWVLLWGVHTRRVVRSPLPEPVRDDPFWYLKKQGTASGDAEAAPESAAENERNTEDGA